MADRKPIITIDIDDTRFQAFLAKFEEYQNALQELPEDWQAAGEAMGRAGQGIEGQGEAIDRNSRALATLKKHAQTLDEIWAGGAGYFAHMRRDTEHITKSISEISRHFLSFGRLGGITGLLGLGGIAGAIAGALELTRSASTLRTQSLSAGVPARQLQALNASFGAYFGDVNGILNQIALAQSSLSPAFGALGVPGAANAAPSQAFIEIAGALRAHDRAIPLSQMALDPLVRYGESLGFSLPMQRLLRNLPADELSQVVGQYQRQVAQTPAMKRALSGFQSLERALSRAATSIENELVVKLGDAAPQLTKLIDSVTTLAIKFIDLSAYLGKLLGQQGQATVGAIAGGVTGAVIGGAVGGPVGAVVGGVIGAAGGATALGPSVPPQTPAQKRYYQEEEAAWDRYVASIQPPSGPRLSIGETQRNAWLRAYEKAHPPPPGPQSALPMSSPRLASNAARFGQYYAFLTQREYLTDRQARALLANAFAEHGGNPAGTWWDVNGPSGGMFAWHKDRLTAMQAALGKNWASDPFGQLDYAVKEERRRDPGFFTDRGSASDLTYRFESGFERPRRLADAGYRQQIAAELKRRMPVHPAGVASASASSGLAQGGAMRMHPVAAARAAKGNTVNVNVRSDASANSIVTVSQLPVY